MAEPTKQESRRAPARTIAGGVVVALAALFAVLNLDEVKVNWIVTTGHAPLIVVIVVALGLGLAAGWLAGRRRHQD